MIDAQESSHGYVVLLLALALTAIAVSKIYAVVKDPISRVPGPQYTKWTNLRLKYETMTGMRVYYVHSLHEKYGSIVRIAPGEVSIADVDAARTIYKVGGPYYKTTWYQKFVGDTRETAIFTTIDPKNHSIKRNHMSWFFSEKSLAIMEPIISDNCQLATEQMQKEMRSLGVIDVYKWFFCLATDIIGDVSFGESFGTLKRGKIDQYLEDLRAAGRIGTLRVEFPTVFALLSYLPFGKLKAMGTTRARMVQYAKESVNRYLSASQKSPDDLKPTVLAKEYGMVANGKMEYDQLVRDAMSNLVAGTDTTANTLTFITWMLSQHPEIEKELVREVSALPDGFDDNDLKQCKLLHGVMYETLRLRSIAGQGLPRLVPAGGAELCGYWLPHATVVSIQAYTMHRLPSVWRDAETFDPSRWDHPTKEMNRSFLPFGGGSMICLGMHLTQMEMRYAIAHFYRAFDKGIKASSSDGFNSEDMKLISFFLSCPQGERCLLEQRA